MYCLGTNGPELAFIYERLIAEPPVVMDDSQRMKAREAGQHRHRDSVQCGEYRMHESVNQSHPFFLHSGLPDNQLSWSSSGRLHRGQIPSGSVRTAI